MDGGGAHMAINFTPPTSWNFDGADWENPNPLDFRYWASIRAAIEERWIILFRDRISHNPQLDAISPYQFIVNNAICRTIGSCLDTLADYFIDPDGRENWADFPNLLGKFQPVFPYDIRAEHTLQVVADRLYNRKDCHYNILPLGGSPAISYGDFLKSCYNALNKLTIYAPEVVPCEEYLAIDAGNGEATFWEDLQVYHSQEALHSKNLEIKQRWARVARSGISETYREHTSYGDTTSTQYGAFLSNTYRPNPSQCTNFTTSHWYGSSETEQSYGESLRNYQLTFDLGLFSSPVIYHVKAYRTRLSDTWDDNFRYDYDITVYRETGSQKPSILYYPRRPLDGNILLLLYAGMYPTASQIYGYPDIPDTYESPISEGFHIFDIGKISDSATFTLGDENTIPSYYPVSQDHPLHTVGASYCCYFLIDYGIEGGFKFCQR